MRWLEAPAYALSVAFWLLTSLYALLSSQPFAYEQFLQPELVPPLAAFARWHAWLDLAVLALSAAARWPALRSSGRRATAVLLGTWGAIALVLLLSPPLFALAPGPLALLLAGLALAPIALLCWAEWSAAPASAHAEAEREAPRERTADDFHACLAAGLAAALLYAGVARLTGLTPSAQTFGAGAASLAQSLLLHELLFLAAFCALTLVRGLAAFVIVAPHRAEIALATASLAALAVLAVHTILLPGLSLAGPAASAVGAAFGGALALAIAVRGVARSDPASDAVARVLRPLAPQAVGRSLPAAALWLFALGALAALLAVLSSQLDFNQIVSRIGVGLVWLLVLATCLRAVRPGIDRSPAALYLAASAVLGAHVALGSEAASANLARAGVDVAQARSAALGRDPSFRLLGALLEPPGRADAQLFAFLRAHTNVPRSLAIPPAELSLAPLGGPPAAYRPHVFLFVVDSLRRDYLSPYDAAVSFTPEIGRFAAQSTVFRHAFTRYGATGLSVPALWAGAPLLHKQYVTPFAPMNALAKLLAHERYAQWIGMDNILDVILPPSTARAPLDDGVMVKDFRFCRTLSEIEQRLDERAPGDPPVFAYSLPQDIHVSVIAREGGRSIDDAAYPGFSAPVASRIRRFDACFGHFLDTLRRSGLYDDSLIILTSDHGDSLGEEGRFGHAYGLFPEVIRIPLIVSLPARLRERLETDSAAPVYNTDVTPTLYRVLGHALAPSTPLFGRPLFAAPGERLAERDDAMVASSYGAVYGALLDDASRLYVVDTVNAREYGYTLAPDAQGAAIAVDGSLRSRGQQTIRSTIEALADLHGYAPKP